jgi:hypothetical protein
MLSPFMHFTIAQHSRWILPLLGLMASVLALLLGILLIQSEHELGESTKINAHQLTGSAFKERSSLARHELSFPAKNGATISETTSPSLAETHHEGDEGVVTEVAIEEVEPVTPDAPPFVYEINQSKVSRLDVDQQIAVQKAFEKYLVAGYQSGDLNSLRERSEQIKEELSAEVGPMTVHDLMQAE